MSDLSIILDLTTLQGEHGPERGIPRWTREATRALLRIGAPVTMLGLNPVRAIPDHFPTDLLDTGLVGWLTQRSVEASRRSAPTVVHLFSPFDEAFPLDASYPPAASAPGCITTATYYDAIPFREPDRYLGDRLNKSRYEAASRMLATCDHLFAISAHSAREAIAHLSLRPDQVTNVDSGVSDLFLPSSETGDPWGHLAHLVPGLRPGFVLAVGGDDPRKNFERLLEAFVALDDSARADRQLVQVGHATDGSIAHWERLANEAGVGDRLICLGRIDDEVLLRLYQGCGVFVFPSLGEGFGLPVLEAARSGAVVITSDRTSVPAILEAPETTFNPDSTPHVTAKLTEALVDEAFRNRARQAGARAVERLTWDNVATRMLSVWQEQGRIAPFQPVRPKIAVVASFSSGPAMDGATGRANLALATGLADLADVTCFDASDHAITEGPLTVLPAIALGTTVSQNGFDHVVHLLGPAPVPGSFEHFVAAPDVVSIGSSGIAAGYAAWSQSPVVHAWLNQELRRSAGPRLRPDLRDGGPQGASPRALGRPFGGLGLLDRAHLVLVPDEHTAALCRLDLGPLGHPTTIAAVGPVFSPTVRRSPIDAHARADGPVIVLGREVDQPTAVAHLERELGLRVEGFDPDLTFVGERVGRGPAVSASADADARWLSLLGVASVVIDLDSDRRSDAMHYAIEALEAGVPVVSTGSWAMALPDDVVVRLAPTLPPVTIATIVGSLATKSPLRRRQCQRIDAFFESLADNHSARALLAAVDGEPVEGLAPLPGRELDASEWNVAAASSICRTIDFERSEFLDWCDALAEPLLLRRKLWEWVVIAQAATETDMVGEGRRGLGFGVGTEPLTAAFAARGTAIVATDLDPGEPEAGLWAPSAQLATARDDLNGRGLCPPQEFDRLVHFEPADMTAISPHLVDFDFCWSSCAFEHLGTIAAGLQFVEDSLGTLRPGGVAIHTTELVLSSDERTIERGDTVLFRERDFEALRARLAAQGHTMAPLDVAIGDAHMDNHVDWPPFKFAPNLKLELGGHITTSIAIIVTKGGAS